MQKHAGGPSVGRPHIADALVEKGYIESRDEAFTELLHDGGAAYVERARLTAADAIRLARAVQAVPVIAHPVTMNLTREGYASTFIELTDLGLGGIEAHHPMHDLALRAHLTDLAAQLGIAATGGSDYHGATKRAYRVGVGKGDLHVPESAVEELYEQRNLLEPQVLPVVCRVSSVVRFHQPLALSEPIQNRRSHNVRSAHEGTDSIQRRPPPLQHDPGSGSVAVHRRCSLFGAIFTDYHCWLAHDPPGRCRLHRFPLSYETTVRPLLEPRFWASRPSVWLFVLRGPAPGIYGLSIVWVLISASLILPLRQAAALVGYMLRLGDSRRDAPHVYTDLPIAGVIEGSGAEQLVDRTAAVVYVVQPSQL